MDQVTMSTKVIPNRRFSFNIAGLIIVIVIILISFTLRIWQLGYSSLWIDEGYTINAAVSISERGIPRLDSGVFYRGGLFYNYLVAGSMKIFGFEPFSPWSARLPALIFGIALVFLIYFLTVKIFNRRVAFLAAAIAAFSTWLIAWSRQARGYSALQFFILLCFYLLWCWLETRRQKFLIWFFISFLLAFFNQYLAVVFLPAFALMIIIHQILHPENRLTKKQWLLISSGAAVFLILSALVVVPLLNQANFYNFATVYNRFVFNELRIFSFGAMFGFILGVFDKKRFQQIISLTIIIFLPYLLVASFGPVVQFRYLLPIFPFVIILLAYAATRICELIWNRLKLPFPALNFGAAVLVVFGLGFSSFTFLPKNFYLLEFGSPQPNFKEAYQIIKNLRQPNEIIISPYTQLTKIYLGENGIWLPISLTGKKKEVAKKLINGREYYTGAPFIASEEELLEVIESKNGFVVVDEMTKHRIGQTIDLLTSHPKVKKIYESKAPQLGNIWVYQF